LSSHNSLEHLSPEELTPFAALSDIRQVTRLPRFGVIQDEVTTEESVSGLPMFGNTFPSRTPKRH
jgi:hypothetical protein